jgi:hypothetical protein
VAVHSIGLRRRVGPAVEEIEQETAYANHSEQSLSRARLAGRLRSVLAQPAVGR